MPLSTDPIDQANRIGALDVRALLALIAVVSLGALVSIFWLWVKDRKASDAKLEALSEKHRLELADINEKRLALAMEFEGTVRGLLKVMKPARRTGSHPALPPEEKK